MLSRLRQDAAASAWARPTGSAAPATPEATRRRIRVGLIGLFGIGNSGNDGSLEAVIAAIRARRPDARLVCICPEPAMVGCQHGLDGRALASPPPTHPAARLLDRLTLTVPRRIAHLWLAWRGLGGIDVLLFPGTGVLDDMGTGPGGMPMTIFIWCMAARLRRRRIAFVSVGAGPINHRMSRWLMKMAAAAAVYRSYRDEASREFMASIGLRTEKDGVYPDVAFGLPLPSRTPPALHNPPTIAIGVMAYYGWAFDPVLGDPIYRAYLGKLASLTAQLVDRGCRVRLLTSDTRDGTAVEELVAGLSMPHRRNPRLAVAPPTYTLRELMGQLADVSAVVATRFHTVVCALMLARPTISLGYAAKNDVLMRDVGLGDYCQHAETFDLGALTQQLDRLLQSRAKVQDELAAAVARYRTLLGQQEEALAAGLL
jgi:polysaccharide pyruvyl transferase WcaK-like protein